MNSADNPHDPVFVTQKSREYLNKRQRIDYEEHLSRLYEWLITKGKDRELNRGLAEKTAENYVHRLDSFYRWIWNRENGYTKRVTHEHADIYVEMLAKDDLLKENGETYSRTHKRKETNAIQKLFDYEEGEGSWEPPVTFSDRQGRHADILSKDELKEIREAVLEYRTIPNYRSLTPEERDRWKAELAQRLGKPKTDITPEDWERANTSWKFPSLFWTAIDAALRPVEIERSKVTWLRLDKGDLYIPKRESSKNRDNWKVALSDKTVRVLERWLEERKTDPAYDDTDDIWLNRQNNPYGSAALNGHLSKVLEIADIDTTNREISWYSIRHTVGTLMTKEGSLAEAQEQLRHRNLETTMQYAHPSTEERRDTLDRIG